MITTRSLVEGVRKASARPEVERFVKHFNKYHSLEASSKELSNRVIVSIEYPPGLDAKAAEKVHEIVVDELELEADYKGKRGANKFRRGDQVVFFDVDRPSHTLDFPWELKREAGRFVDIYNRLYSSSASEFSDMEVEITTALANGSVPKGIKRVLSDLGYTKVNSGLYRSNGFVVAIGSAGIVTKLTWSPMEAEEK